MPYITSEDRKKLLSLNAIGQTTIIACEPTNAGDLNYCFSLLAKNYIQMQGMSYQTINDIIGALEGAKLEFYRTTVATYENEKRNVNGDV